MQPLSFILTLAGALLVPAGATPVNKRTATTQAGVIASISTGSFANITGVFATPDKMTVPSGGDSSETYTGVVSTSLASASGETLTIGMECVVGASTGCWPVFAYTPAYPLQPIPGYSLSSTSGTTAILEAIVTSDTTVEVRFIGLSSGSAVATASYTSPTAQGPYTEAIWSVDTGENGLYIDFDQVSWSGCVAYTSAGASVTPADAQTTEELVTPSGQTVSTVYVPSYNGEDIQITYV